MSGVFVCERRAEKKFENFLAVRRDQGLVCISAKKMQFAFIEWSSGAGARC
jgi:hypothetical protein